MAGINDYWQALLNGLGAIGASGKTSLNAHESADPNDATSISEPAVNTAAVVTFAAPGAGFRWVVKAIYAWYTGAAGAVAPASLLVESPAATTKVRVPVAAIAADSLVRMEGSIHGAVNQAVVVTLPIGAAGASGKLYVTAVKEREVAV